ncbi:sporulation-induced protein, partial [Dimargaris xerosporica]
MFFRLGFHQPSKINQLLDQSEPRLEDFLEEEALLQEIRGECGRLLDYLCEPGVVAQLLEYVVGSEFGSHKPRYTYLASEVLSVEKTPFAAVVAGHPNLINQLWGYLRRPSPLGFLQASYFSRVMCAFLQQEPLRMLEYIKAQRDVVPQFLAHIETSAITDLLLKLVSLEEIPEGAGIAEWLSSEDLIAKLVDLLDPHNDPDTHSMAGQVLLDIISISQCNNIEQPSIGTNCLVEELRSEAVVSRIIDYMLDLEAPNATSTLVNGVFIFIELIRRNYSDSELGPQQFKPDYPGPNLMIPVDLSELMRVISHRLGQFKHLLIHPRHLATIHNPAFDKSPPLGFERLRVCELFAELLHCSGMYKLNVSPAQTAEPAAGPAESALDQTNERVDDPMSVSPPKPTPAEVAAPGATPAAVDEAQQGSMATSDSGSASAPTLESPSDQPTDESRIPVGQLLKWKLIEHAVVPTCLDLFFEFPWNNFLHSVVFDMLHQILNLPLGLGCNRSLVLSIFRDAKLTFRIAAAHRLNHAECEKPKGVRFGYMGHLTGIAEEVVRLFERVSSPLLDQLQEFMNNEEWQEYVAALREAKERDRLPLGGERPMPTDNMLAGLQDTSYLEPQGDDMDEDVCDEDDDDDDDDANGRGIMRSGMGGIGGLGLLGGVGAGIEGDQFVRYLSHQITSDLPDHLAGGSSDDDDHDDDQLDDDGDDDAEIEWISEYRKELTFDRNMSASDHSKNLTALAAPRVAGSSQMPTVASALSEGAVFTNRRSSLGNFSNSSDEDLPARAEER